MAKKEEAPQSTDNSKTTYLIQTTRGSLRRISVPSHWRVTFGPLVPGKEGRGNPALRFYEGENQRVCFTDVESFRDASVLIEERVTKVKQQAVNKRTPTGEKQVIVEARVTEWRNPDAPEDAAEKEDQEFLQLTDNAIEQS